jgi:hypothetical protein
MAKYELTIKVWTELDEEIPEFKVDGGVNQVFETVFETLDVLDKYSLDEGVSKAHACFMKVSDSKPAN